MKRIYFSIKTLLIVLFFLGLIITAGYQITPELIAKGIEKQEQLGNTKISMVLTERLMQFFPGSEEARWQAYALAEGLMQGEDRIMIGPNFIGGGVQKTPFRTEEVIAYLERVAQAQNEVMWKYSSYEKVAEIYHMQGNYTAAEEFYLLADRGFDQENKNFRGAEINRKLSGLYLEMGELEKARLLIEKSLTDYTDQQRGEFLHLQGEVYYHLGNYIKAAESFREAMQQSEKDWDQLQEHLSDKESMINATLQEQPVYRQSKARLDQITFLTTGEAEAERGQIRGEILNENTPVSGVMVYLISEKDYDGRTNGFGTMEYGYPSQTDELGRFTFDPIAPGKYFIVLGVKPADLEGVGRFKGLESFGVEAGKITELKYVFKPRVIISEPAGEQMYSPEQGLRITWETVPQAFSYNLHITLKLENGYVSRVYRKNLKGNSYLFSPQGLALRDMNFVARGDRMVLSPSAILGSFYPGAEIYFVVEALDELGRSISDSEGYILQLDGNYPSVQIQDSGRLSRGDQFVIEQKFEEALDAYLALFQENPNDPETLLSLARLYSYGWTEGTSDPVKAVEYYRKLLDVDRAEFIVSEAASAAVQADNDDLALSLFEEIENCFEAHSFWFHLMGELYFKKGEIDQALDYYLKYLNGQNEFRDLGPVAVLLYKGDLNQAITLLQGKDYSQRSRYSSEGQTAEPADIRTILQNIQQYQQGAKSVLSRNEMNRLLLEIIQINGSQRFEKVKVFQEKVLRLGENDVLVNVLIELAKDRR